MSSRRERKVVTVVFVDLVGFTSRAEALDPEDVEAILRPYHARLRDELEARGGTVEKFIGDAVMAVFGAPVAREDDPERAVRSALAIRDGIVDDGTLQVRIGINTGEALVNVDARPEAGEGMVAGDVVNTAARLQAAAPTDGILVGEITKRATERVIVYRDRESIDAKGKAEPVRVWEVVEARSHVGVEAVAGTELVGRARERDLLLGAFERVRAEGATQVITVAGVPGIGKSRLVSELFGHLDREAELTRWRHGRSLPYGEGVAFWAFAQMVKAEAGILDSDDAAAAAEKLREAASVAGPDAAWVEARLRPLVGLESDTVPREESFAAWRRFVEALAEQRPTILAFEDLHWADDDLLDFVDELVDWVTDVPLLVLATARPDLFDRRPAWGGGKRNALTISLGPLDDDDTARLLAALLDRSVLPADVQQQLLARAGGNPLYAEQFARMLDERGDVGELPESVQGIIAARLDSLPPDEKALLLDASVVGKTFWAGAVGRTDAEPLLRSLQRKELVRRERRSAIEGETELAFTHALVRDVAYAQLPRAERAEKHAAVARWLESVSDRTDDLAELLGRHYLAALELSRAAGIPHDELVEAATAVVLAAAERSTNLHALPRAREYAQSALELLPDGDVRRADALVVLSRVAFNLGDGDPVAPLEEAVRIRLAAGLVEEAVEAEAHLANIFWNLDRADDAAAAGERGVELLRDAPPSRAKAAALVETSRLAMLRGEANRAIDVGREALELAERFGDEHLQARVLATIGAAYNHRGADGTPELDRAIEISERIGALTEYVRGVNNRAQNLVVTGELGAAAERYEVALERVTRVGLESGTAWILGQLAGLRTFMGRLDEAERTVARYLEVVAQMPSHYLLGQVQLTLGWISVLRTGTPGVAGERLVEFDVPGSDPQALGPDLVARARWAYDAGRVDEAAALVDRVLEFQDEHGALYYTWLIDLAFLLHDLGRGDEYPSASYGGVWIDAGAAVARGDLARAVEILERTDLAHYEAYTRLRYAETSPEAAREHLDAALALYRSMGATAYVRRAEALLPASA